MPIIPHNSIAGENEDSYRADKEIHAILARGRFHCIALRLHDDLYNNDPEAFKGAKAFREIFPAIRQLPFFMILGPDGKELACLEGNEIAMHSAEVIHRTAADFPRPSQVSLIYFAVNSTCCCLSHNESFCKQEKERPNTQKQILHRLQITCL